MLNLQKIIIVSCMDQLATGFRRNYGDTHREYGTVITLSASMALEHISNSDALYHNMEHTILVALAGQAILEGKHLSEGGVSAKDWTHFMIALLCHDIGYVKGICLADKGGLVATGRDDEMEDIPFLGTDALLAPYHVDRSKLFVRERFGNGKMASGLVDADLMASYIEMTRFPMPDLDWYKDTKGYGALVRAADFIGQLGDPNRIQKCTALFYEFEELGLNRVLGYKGPGDLRESNAKFYWDVVSPYVQEALRYLRITQDGKHWIANLQANVFGSEHGCSIWPYSCS